jgi:hypothetical protein
MGALLADRPEQETGEPAVPARSDDEEIASRDSMDEDVDGAALDDLAPAGLKPRVPARSVDSSLPLPAPHCAARFCPVTWCDHPAGRAARRGRTSTGWRA